MSTKVQPANDAGNEPWDKLADALVRGDQQAAVNAGRSIADFNTAPSELFGVAVRAFMVAVSSDESAGFALTMWHALRALACELWKIENSDGASSEMNARALAFYDAVDAASESTLFDESRETERERAREKADRRPMNEREWLAADLAMKCERRANELLEVAGALQDELAVSFFRDDEIRDATLERARAMLPKPTPADGQRIVVAAVQELANTLSGSTADNRSTAIAVMVDLLLRLGPSNRGGDAEIPTDLLLRAARARKGLGGSWIAETMKLCVALGVMPTESLEGIEDPKQRELSPTFGAFKANVSRWLNGKRGAALALVKS